MILSINKLSKPVRATVWFMFASVLQQSINLITTPIFTRILTVEEYGVINVYQSWLSILSIIISLSLTAGVYNNAMIDFDGKIDEFTSTMLGLTTASTIIFYILYVIFQNKINRIIIIPKEYINIMFLNILLSPAMGFWLAREKFNYRYKISASISIFTAVSGAILSYIMVVNTNGDRVLAKVVGSVIVTLIVSLIIYVHILLRGKKVIHFGYWKYALTFNIPLIPHYLSNVVLAQSDRIIISNMVGNREAGIYGIAYSVATVVSILWAAINSSLVPWTYKNMKVKNYNKILKNTNMIILLSVAICIIFISFAPEIITVLAAPDYREAVWVIAPVVLGIYFIFIAGLFLNIEFYYKKNKFVMIATTLSAVSNVILNIIFIPIYGYIAAAYTTLIGYIILSIIHYLFMKKICIEEIYDIKFIVVTSVILILISGVIMATYMYTIIRFILICSMLTFMVINIKKIIIQLNIIKID